MRDNACDSSVGTRTTRPDSLFSRVRWRLAAHFVTARLPFRWWAGWCLVGLHNPVYVFDHERCVATSFCFWCGRPT